MKFYKPDINDENKVFRNILLTVLYFYFFISIVILVSMFLKVEFEAFSSYFIGYSTVVGAVITNYFAFVSMKEKNKYTKDNDLKIEACKHKKE